MDGKRREKERANERKKKINSEQMKGKGEENE